MKLFSKNEVIKQDLTLEQFVERYSTSVVISEENLSDYLYKIKDTFTNVYNKLSSSVNDKVVIDTISTKFETLHKLKRVKFIDIKDYITSKPENFRGKYIDYTLDLINSSRIVSENTEITLNNLKLAVSSFINEYSDNKVITIYGSTYFKEANKIIETNKKDIAKYFPDSNSSSKAYIKDILKTNNDIEILYKNIEILDSIINLSKINYIAKLTKECSELIDSLITQNTKTNMLSRNNNIKKELVSAIYVSAREVELLNYLYANIIIFYGVFKNLIEDLNNIIDNNHS